MTALSLSRADRLTVLAQSRKADARILAQLKKSAPDMAVILHALRQGADVEHLVLPSEDKNAHAKGTSFWAWLSEQTDPSVWQSVLLEPGVTPPSDLAFFAIERHHTEMLDLLLAQGLSLDATLTRYRGDEPGLIDYALQMGHDAALPVLLAHGANVAVREHVLNTQVMPSREEALRQNLYQHSSLAHQVCTVEGVRFLVAHVPGLDFTRQDSLGHLALERALNLSRGGFRDAPARDWDGVIFALLDAGAPHVVDKPAGYARAHTWSALEQSVEHMAKPSDALLERLIACDPKQAFVPDKPVVGLRLIKLGLDVDLPSASQEWLNRWHYRGGFSRPSSETTAALHELVDLGLNLDPEGKCGLLWQRAKERDNEDHDDPFEASEFLMLLEVSPWVDPELRQYLLQADDSERNDLVESGRFDAAVEQGRAQRLARQWTQDLPNNGPSRRPRI